MGTADPARAEHDPVVVELEDRSAVESANDLSREFIASTIDIEIVVVLETFRMGKEHNADCEGTKTELIGVHDFKRPADRTASVKNAELGRNNEDVVIFLLFAELLEYLRRLFGLAEILRPSLPSQ